jgi:hypothetical protein
MPWWRVESGEWRVSDAGEVVWRVEQKKKIATASHSNLRFLLLFSFSKKKWSLVSSLKLGTTHHTARTVVMPEAENNPTTMEVSVDAGEAVSVAGVSVPSTSPDSSPLAVVDERPKLHMNSRTSCSSPPSPSFAFPVLHLFPADP